MNEKTKAVPEKKPLQKGPNDPALLRRIAKRDSSASEKRQWVRLTRACNNNCIFCLDYAQRMKAGHEDFSKIRNCLIKGRNQNASRLILSGGEPTIHPDFLKITALGKSLGYRHIQTVTNGRMFSYRNFLRRAAHAGLDEITFSVHGHNAKLHDELVGVSGAFNETMAGLKNALSMHGLIVSVDICLNRLNIHHLPEIMEMCMNEGVREFDLLHLIPFGRAYNENDKSLFYDISKAKPYIEYALNLSLRNDIHIWFNRFPPQHLEGHEYLIQDPHKILDEVRGRYDEFSRYITENIKLSCRSKARCKLCRLNHFCEKLDETLIMLKNGSIQCLHINADDFKTTSESGDDSIPEDIADYMDLHNSPCTESIKSIINVHPYQTLRIEAPDADSALELAYKFEDQAVNFIPDLQDGSSLEKALLCYPSLTERISRIYSSTAEDTIEYLRILKNAEIIVYLNPETADLLINEYLKPPSRLSIALKNHSCLSECLKENIDIRNFFREWPHPNKIYDIPFCISGKKPESFSFINASALDNDKNLNIMGFARHYIRNLYSIKGIRCRDCGLDSSCTGLHINRIRSWGFGILQGFRNKA